MRIFCNDFLQNTALFSLSTSLIFHCNQVSQFSWIVYILCLQSFEAEVFRLSQFLNICKRFEQISDLCSVLSREADQPQRKKRKTESTENSYREALCKFLTKLFLN